MSHTTESKLTFRIKLEFELPLKDDVETGEMFVERLQNKIKHQAERLEKTIFESLVIVAEKYQAGEFKTLRRR